MFIKREVCWYRVPVKGPCIVTQMTHEWEYTFFESIYLDYRTWLIKPYLYFDPNFLYVIFCTSGRSGIT